LRLRIVLLADLDYFFAQCEELRNPSLKGKPLVIGMYSGRTEDSGAVSTSNYAARKYGVKSGIPLFLAKKKLEGTDAVFLPVDYGYYEKVSGRIMQILRSYADSFEQVGIDEAYLDVTDRLQERFDSVRNLVEAMKETVRVREGFTFSVGAGPNKVIAKMAADFQKPNGLKVVPPEDVRGFLSVLSVDCLPGVGKKTVARMNAVGVFTIGDLANYDVQRLRELFGKTLGVYFHNAANGVDEEPVMEAGEAESASRISTLKQNSRDLAVILERVNLQIDEVLAELSQKGLSFRQVGVVAIMSDLSVRSRSMTLEKPTKDREVLLKVVQELFSKFLAESELDIRRVGVKVSGFTKEETGQKPLTSYFASQ
jgi:DNA polymerase IV (archaeal DinB-like DNA polymerase)